MQQNRFLMEFINMRKHLNEAPKPQVASQPSAHNKTALIATGKSDKPVMEHDITYKKIINDKPPKADVIEYFRERIEELKTEYDI
jgi:hypothetical protein